MKNMESDIKKMNKIALDMDLHFMELWDRIKAPLVQQIETTKKWKETVRIASMTCKHGTPFRYACDECDEGLPATDGHA